MFSSTYFRSWMDIPHINPKANLLKQEYADGISEFMDLVLQQTEQNFFILFVCFVLDLLTFF